MRVLIMRHGEAEIMAKSDEERHLTEYGRKQATAQGEWLNGYLKSNNLAIQKVIVSPYVRAQETFMLLNQALNTPLQAEIWNGITPYGNATTVADYLAVLKQEGVESVLLVSHLPLAGSIVSELYGKRNPISFYPATIAQLNWKNEKATLESYHYPPEVF